MASTNIRLLRKPYGGSSLGIVIGIDVGTTFSGVSYAVLRPGEIPDIVPVTMFSGLTILGSKVPSVIFYDKDLQIRAIGPQTTQDSVIQDFELEEWIKVEHFKFHLRPASPEWRGSEQNIEEMLGGKTAEAVMGDILRYLYEETASYVKLRQAGDEELWDSVKDRAIFVLGYPNGWKGGPQQRYRNSAVLGGLIPDTIAGHRRIKFVTEGEASALTCLSGGLGPPSLQPGFRFVVADAGGGTIDVSTFEVTKSSPVELKELTPPDGRPAGSIFVNFSAKAFLEEKLRGTKYEDELTLKDIMESFEFKTKREFDGRDGLVRVGDRRDKDAKLGIAVGFMKLSSDDLRSFFDHSLKSLIDAVEQQLTVTKSSRNNTPVWLVGGFGSSPYLLPALQGAFKADGVIVQSPDSNTAKAVANGAVLHFLDNLVTERVCDSNYGTTAFIPFNPLLHEHRERLRLKKNVPDGAFIGPIFSCIARQGASIGVKQDFEKSYYRTCFPEEGDADYTVEILCYDGASSIPYWYNENKGRFKEVGKIEADLSECMTDATLVHQFGSRSYHKIDFSVELKFGTTELEANIKWQVGRVTKRAPAKVIHTLS